MAGNRGQGGSLAMAWRFEPGEGLRKAFRRVSAEEIAKVRAGLRGPEADRDKAIHEARQAFKRLRALVRLAKPPLGSDFAAENRRWRDAGRLLSGSRDTTVLLQSFDKLHRRLGGKVPAQAVKRLRSRIAKTEAGNGADDIEAKLHQVLRTARRGRSVGRGHSIGRIAGTRCCTGSTRARSGSGGTGRRRARTTAARGPAQLAEARKGPGGAAPPLPPRRASGIPRAKPTRRRPPSCSATSTISGSSRSGFAPIRCRRISPGTAIFSSTRSKSAATALQAAKRSRRARRFPSQKAKAFADAIGAAWDKASKRKARKSGKRPARERRRSRGYFSTAVKTPSHVRRRVFAQLGDPFRVDIVEPRRAIAGASLPRPLRRRRPPARNRPSDRSRSSGCAPRISPGIPALQRIGLVAEQGENSDRLGAADDADEIDLEERQAGRMRARVLGDQDRQAVLLRQAFDARGDVHRVADRRIAEALLRAEIADAAGAGVEADADLDRLALASCSAPPAPSAWRARRGRRGADGPVSSSGAFQKP